MAKTTKTDETETRMDDGTSQMKAEAKATPKPTKPISWRQRADQLFLQRMGPRAQRLDPATLAEEAEKRAEYLIAAIEGTRTGRSNYPSSTIEDYEFELQALRNNAWYPGLRRRKQARPSGYNFNVLSVPDPAEAKVDQMLTDE